MEIDEDKITVIQFKDRFDELSKYSETLPTAFSFPWLAAFKAVFDEHSGCKFSMWVGGEQSNTGIHIQTDGDPSIRFEQHLLDKFNHVIDDLKLSPVEIDDLIDNFLIHELIHRVQGFKDGGHTLVPKASIPGLLKIDFDADSYAALVQFSMFIYNQPNNDSSLRCIYLRFIKAVIHQTHIFKYYLKKEYCPHEDLILEKDNEISGPSIVRWAAWHFQYFRCVSFNKDAPIGLIQLNVMPILSFKGVYQGRKVYDQSWHDEDETEDHKNKSAAFTKDGSNVLAICVNNYKISQRSNPTFVPILKFDSMISGIVTGDLNKSSDGMKFIFTSNQSFIGKPYPPSGGAPEITTQRPVVTFTTKVSELNKMVDYDPSKVLNLIFNPSNAYVSDNITHSDTGFGDEDGESCADDVPEFGVDDEIQTRMDKGLNSGIDTFEVEVPKSKTKRIKATE